ncbi:MAG: DUF4956 domain-containing protein [Ignavibacteria bacterium]|jgi:uncharacterized membrane protein YhiD involved in acid resistance|nr:DUF4956 domain-containing protein [Ignavibacteria bacterium]MCU7502943.1 DUF4956 domain-containing protein [Ignavibacteria bacterium]MCU7517074.1 DUF4956 domain-containing protein [Ignavibacteria bacterium]
MDILKLLTSIHINYSWVAVLASFISTTLLSLTVVKIYMITHKKKGYDQDFLQALIFLSLVVTSVMLVIGNNLAGAFGLVGAVSIIRFRTRLDNSQDTAYIFLEMAIGLTCGLQQYTVAVSATVFITLIILILWKSDFGGAGSQGTGNILRVKVNEVISGREIVERTFTDDVQAWDIISITAIDDKKAIIDYKVMLKKNITAQGFADKLFNSIKDKLTVLKFETVQ